MATFGGLGCQHPKRHELSFVHPCLYVVHEEARRTLLVPLVPGTQPHPYGSTPASAIRPPALGLVWGVVPIR